MPEPRIDPLSAPKRLHQLALEPAEVGRAGRRSPHPGGVHVEEFDPAGQTPRNMVTACSILGVPIVAEVDDAQVILAEVVQTRCHFAKRSVPR